MATSSDPSAWTTSDVAAWLRRCNLEQFVKSFEENEIDGSLLLNDGFDDSMMKELIPNLKSRILFNNERKKLKEANGSQIAKSADTGVSVETSSILVGDKTHEVCSSTIQFVQQDPITLPRSDAKKHCKWNRPERDAIQLDIAQLTQPFNGIHNTLITNHSFSSETQNLLSTAFSYMCALPNENEQIQLDSWFNVLVDQPLDAAILIQNIQQHHCLKPYVIDSLKRFNSLSDVMQSLSLCPDMQTTDSESFFDIVDQINKYILLICTIESLSFDSQRFLSNLLIKNDLPIPLTYHTAHEFKINFNNLIEPLCLTQDRFMLLMGSPSAIGLGKTSLIPYIFYNKRNDSLNIDGNREVRSGCIDTIFAKLENNSSYIVFDVHGTVNTLNEDLVTAIQHYCSIQIICVTETDLQQNDFLTSMMNYSEEIRNKPTIVVIFDSNYNNKQYNSTEIINQYQNRFHNESWQNVIFMTAPVLKSLQKNSDFTAARRAQRLRQSFTSTLQKLQTDIQRQPMCNSIFTVQAYYLTIKSGTNVCPAPLCNMTILSQLDDLFGQLDDKTQNLLITTPVSYIDAAILKYEKELSAQWHEPSSSNTHEQLAILRQEYQKVDRMPRYADFFINLITKRPYIELLITEKYLQQWRAHFEPGLIDQMRVVKNEAMSRLSRIKQFEEQTYQENDERSDAERENMLNQLQAMKNEYESYNKRIHDIEDKLANVDLTIGLFSDEILAVYEHYPKLFDVDDLHVLLARKLCELMYKGFSLHVLRGRPLRCHSKLMQECLQYIQQSTNKTPLVLTVIGEQSSAKSSLLNSTFGCNFRVSAGRCTIGMYMSIVRWHENTIVIFDTEGLLSLEESGSIFDNQMVSMAMLSSHLVLINHKGEFSSSLEHLIGMSFYAKLQIRSPLKPKLLFVLRDQSDTNATDIFFRQLSKFKENLYNDSKFLKSSIDDELEINDQHVVLLPNAFSSDTNPILGIEQTWRNRTFPMKILELRNMIFTSLANVNLEVYIDVAHLYQKIACNWNAIDKLGPNLLACKTLYELSVMNELRDIANEITLGCVNDVSQEGRQHIDHVLTSISMENQCGFDPSYFTNLFNIALQQTHEKVRDHAIAEFHLKAERSCFSPELKNKVEKMIEPPISYVQVMLQDEFSDRLYKVRRDARISSAQQRLIDSVKLEFDRNMNLPIEELKTRIEAAYFAELDVCDRTVRPEFESPEKITSKILKFYNSTLQSKAGNIQRNSIYNLLPFFEPNDFEKMCRNFDGAWECMVKREPQEITTGHPLLRAFMKFLFGSSPDEYAEALWYHLQHCVNWWFTRQYDHYKNKKLLSAIFLDLLPQLRMDIKKLLSEQFQSSSDARVITHIIQLIENVLNADVIKRNIKYLSKCDFAADVALIALKTLIDEAVIIEQNHQHMELEKARNDLADWKNTIETQIQLMQNSFEQGRNTANIIVDEIFEEVGRAMTDKILQDVTADIIKSQFINHEAMQKQAYEESIVQANGEKILKYVLDINRFFLELSLREINTSLVSTIHSHMLNAEQIISKVITKSNDIAQESKADNVRLIADAIEQSILQMDLFSASIGNKFAITKVISFPIQNIDQFKQGFKTILLQIRNIREKVTELTENVKQNALAGCKLRLSRRLGCQSCCPGCGAKCSRPEPHEEEFLQPWFECKCKQKRCRCPKPEIMRITCHESSQHIAGAFHGMRFYRSNTPALKLCYQNWKTSSMIINEDEKIFPLQKYYHLHHPEWYNNLDSQANLGTACNESVPPSEQRRAWMVVRHVLLRHYRQSGMIDNDRYDSKLYPEVHSLPDDYEPTWNDTELN